jgi:pyruvate formate lyase activating enzyme
MKSKQTHEAMLFEVAAGDAVRCRLCAHECLIGADKYGLCRVRHNIGGRLVSENYDALVALNVDPIEKKPLFHVLPGSRSLSLAAAGCNFQCSFCQNWQISQAPRMNVDLPGQSISPEQIVQEAQRHDCRSISYTYTEPTVFFELAYDTAALAAAKGIKNIFVSNGYMTPEAVRTISRYLDAINVDLKAFRDETYRRVMKAKLAPVLGCLKLLVECKVWVEVTTLIVPGMNDGEGELRDLAGFIAQELSPDVPWHVSRFHGDFEMPDTPATPVETIQKAVRIGREAHLRYVYSGNVPGDDNESTRCAACGTMLIGRSGFAILENRLVDGRCPKCSQSLPGIWK